jgi:UDP-N-acetyl-D-galactosamine dehydrogenase
MGAFVATEVVKLMASRGGIPAHAKASAAGADLQGKLPGPAQHPGRGHRRGARQTYGIRCDVCDPWASAEEAKREYGIALVEPRAGNDYDAVIIGVAHRQFADMGIETLAPSASRAPSSTT